MRRSKVTLLFSLTCSVACVQTSRLPLRKSREGGRLYTGYCGVDFFMLSPYGPYNKPVFLALIPPSFTSLNPFVTFFRPLQPHSSSHNWESMRIPENAVTRNKRRARNQVASKWVACENIRFSSLFAAKDVSRNVLSDEEGGETDVFAGYQMHEWRKFPYGIE